MTDNRLSSLAMLSIEASCVRSVDLDDVTKAFACQKTRSKPFWNYYNVTLLIIFSWLLLCAFFHVCYCATIQWFLLFCYMATVRQLNSPAFWEGSRIGLQRNCSHLFATVWCAPQYLDKNVWHHLLCSCYMNVVISLVRSDQWTAPKFGFGLNIFILLFTQAVPKLYPSGSQSGWHRPPWSGEKF